MNDVSIATDLLWLSLQRKSAKGKEKKLKKREVIYPLHVS